MITADEARAMMPDGKHADLDLLRLHLNYIDEMIKVAARQGDVSVMYINRIFYTHSGSSLLDYRFEVGFYNKLVRELEDKGFRVSTFAGPNMLRISWETPS